MAKDYSIYQKALFWSDPQAVLSLLNIFSRDSVLDVKVILSVTLAANSSLIVHSNASSGYIGITTYCNLWTDTPNKLSATIRRDDQALFIDAGLTVITYNFSKWWLPCLTRWTFILENDTASAIQVHSVSEGFHVKVELWESLKKKIQKVCGDLGLQKPDMEES